MSDLELYRPSNGEEGRWFTARWCDTCEHDRAFRENPDEADSCPIYAATMAFPVDHPSYPREWREDGPEGPRCTAYCLAGNCPLSPFDADRQHSLFGRAA